MTLNPSRVDLALGALFEAITTTFCGAFCGAAMTQDLNSVIPVKRNVRDGQ